MKCVIDLDLLNPPPIPDTQHFREMLLHQRKMDRLAQLNVKISLSYVLQGMVWPRWNEVEQLQYRSFLLNVLIKHCAPDFPGNLRNEVDTSRVLLEPLFLSGEREWVDSWLVSLMACYLDAQFNTGGAFLATWPHPDFENQDTVQVTYHDLEEVLPAVWSEAQWDELLGQLLQSPIPFTSNLRAYADEGENWIAVVVIAEYDANSIARVAMEAYNQDKPSGCSTIDDIHFRTLDEHGDAQRRERARRLLAQQIVERIRDTDAVCFVVSKSAGRSLIEAYPCALSETLHKWHPDLIRPIYIDTPYDRASDDRKNRDLCSRVFNAIQGKGFDCTSNDIVLGKSRYYCGLGIADAIAYLYKRREDDEFWRDLWRLVEGDT